MPVKALRAIATKHSLVESNINDEMVLKPMKANFADTTGGISKCELTHSAVDICYFKSFGASSVARLSRRAIGSLT